MPVRDLGVMIQERIDALDRNIRALNTQIARADQILLEMGEAIEPVTQEQVYDSSEDEWETEYLIDSDDDSDDETVVYYTPWEVNHDDSDYDSDTDTVVGKWEDDYTTPEKTYRFIIPDNLEEGLEFLG
jgi:hypothetical protein